jgi:hypothetical protein
MKALTIWQPWASLILVGAKPYEFRGWPPPKWLIGRRLAIHAGMRPVKPKEVRALLLALKGGFGLERPSLIAEPAIALLERVERGLVEAKKPTLAREAFRLPLGAVIATATVGEPKRGDECARDRGIAVGGNDSDRGATFNWGWPMLDVEPLLPPVETAGAQGLWDWASTAQNNGRTPKISADNL